jgi:hypothetical protein
MLSPARAPRFGSAQERIAALESERRRLADEAEFCPGGRALPPKPKSDFDRNDAALKTQRTRAEPAGRGGAQGNELYDQGLVKRRRLWKP